MPVMVRKRAHPGIKMNIVQVYAHILAMYSMLVLGEMSGKFSAVCMQHRRNSGCCIYNISLL